MCILFVCKCFCFVLHLLFFLKKKDDYAALILASHVIESLLAGLLLYYFVLFLLFAILVLLTLYRFNGQTHLFYVHRNLLFCFFSSLSIYLFSFSVSIFVCCYVIYATHHCKNCIVLLKNIDIICNGFLF